MSSPAKTVLLVLFACMVFAFIAGCENEAQSGALIGAGLGTAIGAIAGGDSQDMLIGAGVGTAAGYFLGNESDKKKTELTHQQQLAAARSQQQNVQVWVTNSNGSKLPINLKKSGPNYIGPRGEYYNSLPDQEELRLAYGF